MPPNPFVAFNIRGVGPFEDPVQRETQLLNLQRMRQLAADDARARQEQQALRLVYQKHASKTGIDAPAAISELYARGFAEKAQEFQKLVADSEKQLLDAEAQELANERTKLALGHQILGGVRDESSYRLARERLTKIDPDFLDFLPDAYDKDAIDRSLEMTITAEEFNDRRKAALEQTTTQQDWIEELFAVATTAEEWQLAQQLARFRGIPQDLLDFFGDYSTENVARARRMVSGVGVDQGARQVLGTSEFANHYRINLAAAREDKGQPLTAAEQQAVRDTTLDEIAETAATRAEKARTPPSLQRVTALVAGKPTLVNYNAATGLYTRPGSETPVEALPLPTTAGGTAGATGLTDWQAAQLEQWRYEQLAELDDVYGLLPADRQRREAQINETYQRARAGGPQAAQELRTKINVRPIPTPVQEALAGQPDGRYRFKDPSGAEVVFNKTRGVIWRKP
jgi:hypothetical protein